MELKMSDGRTQSRPPLGSPVARTGRWAAAVLMLAALAGCQASGVQPSEALAEPGVLPANGSVVPINVTLRWPAVEGATAYDIYFSEDGQGGKIARQLRVKKPEFRLETLSAGKSYLWRADPIVEGNTTAGTVRHFKTRAHASTQEKYAWSIKSADSFRRLYPEPAGLGSWNYTEGITCDGLYAIALRTGREQDIAFVKGWLDRFIREDGSVDPEAYPFALFSLDRVRPGPVALWMYERTKQDKYLKAAQLMARQLDEQPKTSDGGYWHRSTYPNQMWLDGIYMADVFSVQYGLRTNQPRYLDEAIKQIRLVHQHTHDPKTGLYYHGWDETKTRPWANKETGASPEFWARAIGWYAMALADVLDWLPADHPGRQEVTPIIQNLCASLLKYQDHETGMWWQILDKPTGPKNYVETSATLMFAYAMARGAQRGWLAPEYLDHSRRATRGVLNKFVDLREDGTFDLQGTVTVGSLGGNGGFYDYYVSVGLTPNDLKGVGAFMYLSMVLSEAANDCGPRSRQYPRKSP